MKEYTIAFDCTLHRPACVLIQAGIADIPSGLIHKYFPVDSWLLSPTPDMKVYEVTKEELVQLSEKVKAALACSPNP